MPPPPHLSTYFYFLASEPATHYANLSSVNILLYLVYIYIVFILPLLINIITIGQFSKRRMAVREGEIATEKERKKDRGKQFLADASGHL